MPQPALSPLRHRSSIVVHDLEARTDRVVFVADGIVEAPNWSRDGSYLLVNTTGSLWRLSLPEPLTLEPISLGAEGLRCNNDHDLSPDGTLLGFSATDPECDRSRVFVSNADGTNVRLLTPRAPSYLHGWSPDGRWVAFVGERGDGRFGLYRVPVQGGDEECLTSSGGYDDGPEYSADGRWIYFNSDRSGSWAIWRMPADGAGKDDHLAERVTFDEPEDWFPHPSPDGRWLLFLSFPPGTTGHDERMAGVQLRLRPAPGDRIEPEPIEVLATVFGGQGTLNVNPWSPDSRRFAYVTYA